MSTSNEKQNPIPLTLSPLNFIQPNKPTAMVRSNLATGSSNSNGITSQPLILVPVSTSSSNSTPTTIPRVMNLPQVEQRGSIVANRVMNPAKKQKISTPFISNGQTVKLVDLQSLYILPQQQQQQLQQQQQQHKQQQPQQQQQKRQPQIYLVRNPGQTQGGTKLSSLKAIPQNSINVTTSTKPSLTAQTRVLETTRKPVKKASSTVTMQQQNKLGVPSTRVYIAQSSTSSPSTNGQTHSLKPVSLLEGLSVQNGAQLNKSTTLPISPVNRRESPTEPINLCNDQPIDLAVKSFSLSTTTTTVPGKSLAMPTVKLVSSSSPTSQLTEQSPAQLIKSTTQGSFSSEVFQKQQEQADKLVKLASQSSQSNQGKEKFKIPIITLDTSVPSLVPGQSTIHHHHHHHQPVKSSNNSIQSLSPKDFFDKYIFFFHSSDGTSAPIVKYEESALESVTPEVRRYLLENYCFNCKVCLAKFTSDQQLFEHCKTHEESPSFPCLLCTQRFEYRHQLREHERQHVLTNPSIEVPINPREESGKSREVKLSAEDTLKLQSKICTLQDKLTREHQQQLSEVREASNEEEEEEEDQVSSFDGYEEVTLTDEEYFTLQQVLQVYHFQQSQQQASPNSSTDDPKPSSPTNTTNKNQHQEPEVGEESSSEEPDSLVSIEMSDIEMVPYPEESQQSESEDLQFLGSFKRQSAGEIPSGEEEDQSSEGQESDKRPVESNAEIIDLTHDDDDEDANFTGIKESTSLYTFNVSTEPEPIQIPFIQQQLRHQPSEHTNSEGRIYIHCCPTCLAQFDNPHLLRCHMLTDSCYTSSSCNFCGQGFHGPVQLNEHTSENRCQFYCAFCGADQPTYKTYRKLQRHLQAAHTKEPLFVSPLCDDDLDAVKQARQQQQQQQASRLETIIEQVRDSDTNH